MEKNVIMNQLKYSIQVLSLEADDQIAYFPDFVVVTDELLLEFDNWRDIAITNFPEYFSKNQISILHKIDKFIDDIPAENQMITIEEELRKDDFWKELRILAKEALRIFGWKSEIPPNDTIIYIEG